MYIQVRLCIYRLASGVQHRHIEGAGCGDRTNIGGIGCGGESLSSIVVVEMARWGWLTLLSLCSRQVVSSSSSSLCCRLASLSTCLSVLQAVLIIVDVPRQQSSYVGVVVVPLHTAGSRRHRHYASACCRQASSSCLYMLQAGVVVVDVQWPIGWQHGCLDHR